MTKKLFHNNSYKTKFKAKVLEKDYKQGNTVLILDQTCFYPNAGGQLCDTGIIEGYPVIDVQEMGKNIFHYIDGEIPVKRGDTITGEIDWNSRFDHMQQHSGQHVLSALFIKVWQKETLSFHMGEEICTIDIPSTTLDEKKVERIEGMANEIIYSNKPIYQYYAVEKSNISLELRKKQKKMQEQLRIVEITGVECTACGGTHCNNTAELAIIKIIGWENRKDKSRISFLCGHRALSDYQNKHRITKNLSTFFTTGVNQLEYKVAQATMEQKRLIKEYRNMEKELINYHAQELRNNYFHEEKGYPVISRLFDEKSESILRQISFILINEQKCVVILGAKKPQPVITLACTKELDINAGEIMKQVISEFNGAGGGSKFWAAGKFDKNDDVLKVFERLSKLIL
jgi:alanyl-tRNA synthetase